MSNWTHFMVAVAVLSIWSVMPQGIMTVYLVMIATMVIMVSIRQAKGAHLAQARPHQILVQVQILAQLNFRRIYYD